MIEEQEYERQAYLALLEKETQDLFSSYPTTYGAWETALKNMIDCSENKLEKLYKCLNILELLLNE